MALGYAGPIGTRHAARYADIWAPVDAALVDKQGKPDVDGRLRAFYQMVEEEGRRPGDVSITLFNLGGETEAMIDHYATLGIERFVFGPPTFMRHDAEAALTRLDELGKYIEKFN